MAEFRVVVAISDPMLRALLVAHVEQVGHTVVAEVESPEALPQTLEAQQPDALVLQWLSFGGQGGDALASMAAVHPAMRLIALVDQQQPKDRHVALGAGAWACIATPHCTMDVMTAMEVERPTREQPAAARVEEAYLQEVPIAIPAAASAARSAGMSFLRRAI